MPSRYTEEVRSGHCVKTMIVYTLFEVIVYTFLSIKQTPFNPWITMDQVGFS